MAKSESMGVSEGEVLEKGSNSKSRELKKELQRLVLEIIDSGIEDEDVDNESDNNNNNDNNDNNNNNNNNNGVILGTIDKAIQALTALKELKLKKKKHSISFKVDQLIVPDEYRCPISKEIMKDPVILSTGQTYDRPFIQKWLKDGNRTCPQTQQVLAHMELTPNRLVRELITQWCKDHGTELPPPVQDINDGLITDADRNRLSSLLEKMSSNLSDQKEAAKEIRMLTRRMPSFRSFFGEYPNAIPQLLGPLTTAETFENHPDLQEDLITTVLNLSIHDNNKKLIAEYPLVIPLLVESLKCGTMETRANAAAALFSLSALDDNKLVIGELGALKPLLELLKQGHQSAMKDVASAIFNLCKKRENRGIAVGDGAVKVILDKIKERVHVSEMLAILALLSTHHTALEELEKLNSVGCLLSIIRESNCEPDRENCIVILHDICGYSRFALKDVRDDEKENGTLSKLAENGTSRAQRKANGILDRFRSSRRINYTHTA